MNDDSFAEAYVENADENADTSPQWHEYTPTVARLDAVIDRLGELTATLIAVQPGGKPPKVKPMKRPTTAIDKARNRSRASAFDSLLTEVAEAQDRFAAMHN